MNVLGIILSVVTTVVPLVEKLIGRGRGDEKKEAAQRLIYWILERFGVAVTPGVRELIDEAIDVVVVVMNLTGAFETSKKPEEYEIVPPEVPTSGIVAGLGPGVKPKNQKKGN